MKVVNSPFIWKYLAASLTASIVCLSVSSESVSSESAILHYKDRLKHGLSRGERPYARRAGSAYAPTTAVSSESGQSVLSESVSSESAILHYKDRLKHGLSRGERPFAPTTLMRNAIAIQLQDGTVYFEQPPRLLEAVTTQNTAYVWGATYYFTVRLPENAGEPLQRVTINQHDGIEYVRLKLEDTEAFEGTYGEKGADVNLAEVKSDRQNRSVAIAFSPPVPPGKTVTIALYPRRNPKSGGIYQFGVTAFPPGEKSHGQFLGFGRLHFYGYGDRIW